MLDHEHGGMRNGDLDWICCMMCDSQSKFFFEHGGEMWLLRWIPLLFSRLRIFACWCLWAMYGFVMCYGFGTSELLWSGWIDARYLDRKRIDRTWKELLFE